MTVRRKIFALFAWLQLLISILMGVFVIWVYLSYRAPMNQLIESVETTMLAGSSLLEGTLGSIEARSDYLDESLRLLVALKYTLLEVSGAVKSQQIMVPEYTESLRSASSIAVSMGQVLHHTGNDLMNLQVPNGIKIHHGDVKIKYHYPFKNLAGTLEQSSQEFKSIGTRISLITETMVRDVEKMGATTLLLVDQTLKVVEETYLRLEKLKQGLPKALEDLRLVSDSLKKLSAQVHFLYHIGIALLAFGLLISAWCFLHSIGALMIVRSQAFEKPAS